MTLLAADLVETSDDLEFLISVPAVHGTPGDDSLVGTVDDDKIHGLAGNDTIDGLGGNDFLKGGIGDDQLFGGDGLDQLTGGTGNDALDGGLGDDILRGGQGDNSLTGGDGDDLLSVIRGDNVLNGGDGVDAVDFSKAKGDMVVDLAAGTASGDGSDTLVSIENITTGSGNDFLSGSDGGVTLAASGGDDTLVGGTGDDLLFGASGNDSLDGGLGQDTLAGGGGNDVFVFTSVMDSDPTAPDLINLLKHHDVIDLSGIDADATQGGDQSFVLVSAFDGHAGELTLQFSDVSNNTTLSADVDGDGVADMVVIIQGNAADFHNFVL